MQSTYEQLREIIVKARPEIKNFYNSGSYKVFDENLNEIKDYFDKDITLDDVLIVLGDGFAKETANLSGGELYWKFDSSDPGFTWTLGQPLHLQSQETQEALLKLLS